MSTGRKTIMSKQKFVEGKDKFPPVLHGLKGIQSLFNVSKSTAFRYKETILRDAVTQNGKIIVVDTVRALELFGMMYPDHIVKQQL